MKYERMSHSSNFLPGSRFRKYFVQKNLLSGNAHAPHRTNGLMDDVQTIEATHKNVMADIAPTAAGVASLSGLPQRLLSFASPCMSWHRVS